MPKPLRPGRISEGWVVCILGVAVFAFFLASVAPKAQSFRSRIDIVQVTVTVTDSEGRLITGLTKDDFQIFEDGNAQDITQFTDARVPVSLGVLLDASDSMRGQPIVDAREAFDRFVGELLLGEDEALVASFNHRPQARDDLDDAAVANAEFARVAEDHPEVRQSTTRSRAHRSCSSSGIMCVPRWCVISDGADTASDHSLLQALEDIRRSDALVYAIAIDSVDAKESTRVNPEALREITSLTAATPKWCTAPRISVRRPRASPMN